MDAMFTTNQYKVLEIMYENTLTIAEEKYCPLGQGEIAKQLEISRAVVNKVFNDLKENGYISMVTRGKWKLSNGAINLIQITQGL
jgi:Mn-dependent DtxR family transcriptional regulator